LSCWNTRCSASTLLPPAVKVGENGFRKAEIGNSEIRRAPSDREFEASVERQERSVECIGIDHDRQGISVCLYIGGRSGVTMRIGFGCCAQPIDVVGKTSQTAGETEASTGTRGCEITINIISYAHDDLPPRTGFHHWPSAFRRRSDSCSQPDPSPQAARESPETAGIC